MAGKSGLKVYIDRIDEGVATVVLSEDDTKHFNVPATFLPGGVKEGDHLQLTFKKDRESRDAEKKKANELLKELLAQNQEGKK
jgi:hypothetical protein